MVVVERRGPSEMRVAREAVAQTRILNILQKQGVANLRTLEHKIADAGPYNQRVQPHIITSAKQALLRRGDLIITDYERSQWYHRANENPAKIQARLAELQPIWARFTNGATAARTGQALEIAVWRALRAAGIDVYGGFDDLNQHDDSKLYHKVELQSFNGATIGKHALDFIVRVGNHHCGIEVKNTRPWFYAHDPDLRELIRKALTLQVQPVLIARRIQYVTFRVLGTCGLIMHETYNQRMANADTELANLARHKDLLGYHDIRTGNLADARLANFFTKSLPAIVDQAQEKVARYRDLLWAFSAEKMAYEEFAARVRRREQGQNEDNDWPDEASEGQVD